GAVDTRNRGVNHVQEQEIGSLAVGLRQAQGAIEDLGIGLAMLQRHTDARQRMRPECLDQSKLTLAGGPHAGDGRTSGLIVTQKSKLATLAISATRTAPTSQSRGSGPNRTPDLPAS